MKEWIFGVAKDQAIALLCGIAAVYWLAPTTAGGKVFTIFLVVVVLNAILAIWRWIGPTLRSRTKLFGRGDNAPVKKDDPPTVGGGQLP